jgi:membrane fusion protein (multidrug efflux system)
MDDEQSRSSQQKQPDKPKDPPEDIKGTSFFAKPFAIIIGTLVLALLFFFGLAYLIESFTHESTDDAFLDGPIVSVAPRISGQIKEVFIHNNQRVKGGDPIALIDPSDLALQTELKKAAHESARANEALAKASLDLLRAQITAAEATVRQSRSEVEAVTASSQKAAADLKRAEDLMQQKTISPQEFDVAKTAASVANANLQAAKEKSASDEAKVVQAQAQLEAGIKAFERATAQTAQAKIDTKSADLNLSYTKIVAPEDGFITRKAVEPGDYVQPGQRLLALVTDRLWVTANFKETQLRSIRTNQPAAIMIDAQGGTKYDCYVESIQAGSGARFSLLPPENAVGNYIKVVQRVPVRLFFKQPPRGEHVLGPGMSVSPSVRVSDFSLATPIVALIAVVLALLVGLSWWAATKSKRR